MKNKIRATATRRLPRLWRRREEIRVTLSEGGKKKKKKERERDNRTITNDQNVFDTSVSVNQTVYDSIVCVCC